MPDVKESKKVLEDVKALLNTYRDEIEKKVQEHVSKGLGESDKKVEELRELQKQNEETLKNVSQQLKYIGSGLPGLREDMDSGNVKFSIQNVCKALYKAAHPGTGGDPWNGCEGEYDVIKSYEGVMRERGSNYAADGSAGGVLIPPEISDEIIGLVHAAIPLLEKLPTRKLNGLVGQLIIPQVITGPSAAAVGENSAPTTSQASYGRIVLDPKRVAGMTMQSKSLIYQSAGVSDQIIKEELALALSRQVHNYLALGSGNDDQPAGLTNSKWGIGTSVNAALTNGGRFTITDAMMLQMDIAVANEGDAPEGNYGYLFRPEVLFGMLTERVKQYSGQEAKDGAPVVQNMGVLTRAVLKDLIGSFGTTTQLSATETKGTDTTNTLSSVFYGNWAHFWCCFWQGFTLRVSDQAYDGTTSTSAFAQNMMFIIAEQFINCAVTRATAFKKCTGAQTAAASW